MSTAPVIPGPPEPEALVRFRVGCLALGGYYAANEIAGCRSAQAAFLVEKGIAEVVTPAQRDAVVAAAREAEARATSPDELVYVRFLMSWAVHGSYYNAGEIAGFRGEQARFVVEARTKEGSPLVRRLSAQEVDELRGRIAASASAAAQQAEEPLVLVRFLISLATYGTYYCAGEVAGFSRQKAEELLAMHTLAGDRFVELIGEQPGPITPATFDIPDTEDGVIGLTDRDPDGVAEMEAAREKAQRGAPADKMNRGDRRK